MTLRPLFVGSNHICCLKITVTPKVAKSFLMLFPVTYVKIEVHKQSLHQTNHLKAYFMTCFMQNTQTLNMLGCTDQSVYPETYGRPCIGSIQTFKLHTWIQNSLQLTVLSDRNETRSNSHHWNRRITTESLRTGHKSTEHDPCTALLLIRCRKKTIKIIISLNV